MSFIISAGIVVTIIKSYNGTKVSNFILDKNLKIQFKINSYVLYFYLLLFFTIKVNLLYSIVLNIDRYMKEIFYNTGSYIFILNDVLMILNLMLTTFISDKQTLTILSFTLSLFETVIF